MDGRRRPPGALERHCGCGDSMLVGTKTLCERGDSTQRS